MPQAGYSGRPLAAKLGLKPGMTVWRHAMPEAVAALLDAQEPDQRILPDPSPGLGCAHIFVTEQEALASELTRLRRLIAADGMIWVSWPKKSSKVPTSITEDTIRGACLPLGLVDVKVCAVDEIWSGLKLVIRKELRTAHQEALASTA